MDVLTTDGVLYEVKGWKTGLETAKARLAGGFDPILNKDVKYSSQFFKDLVSVIKDPAVKKVWRFSDEALENAKPELVDSIVKAIKSNRSGYAVELRSVLDLGIDEFEDILQNELKGYLKQLMNIE